ncbi:MAG: 30S ribosomal protein S4e [Candidatus Bathyarchaeota archaeon]
MGSKGGLRHLKRLASPSFWPIHRKEKVWVSKPKPGPHPLWKSMPLLVLLRDFLKVAKTAKEAKIILAGGDVKVDGVKKFDVKYSIGLMDVVEISSMNITYRVISSPSRMFQLHPITDEEKTFKLNRVENKTSIKGGNIQLGLHDGKNLTIKIDNPSEPIKDFYNVHDVLKINLLDNQILEHLKFTKGAYALITGGKNTGRHGNIIRIEETASSTQPIIVVKDSAGNEYASIIEYIFIIGKDISLISLPERT